jgi:hypothetical protein
MSSIRRTRPTRSILTTVAIGAVTTLGLVIAAPGSGAFASVDPRSPEARVGHSIESGHILDDMKSGKITEADIVHAASTGIDVHGQHIDNWIDLSAEQSTKAAPQVEQLNAAAQADPRMRAARDSLKGADSETRVVPANKGAEILESKHWWNHLIHWFTIYLNNAWLRGLITVSAGAAAIAICAFFDISRVTCAIIGVFMGGFTEVLKSSHLCNGKGLYIKLPDDWNSHCE